MQYHIRQAENAKKQALLVAAMSVAVFLFHLSSVFQSLTITVVADEPVPYAIAMYWAGVNWAEVVSLGGYYSYGYSVLLLPLVLIFKDAVVLYRATLVMNCVFAALVVPLSYFVARRIFKAQQKAGQVLLFVTVLLSAVYSANIVRSNMAWCEMLLILLTWCDIGLVFSLDEKPTNGKLILFGASLMYGYMVHQRMLGVLVAGIVVMAAMLWSKKITGKQFLFFLGPLLLLLAVHIPMKQYLQTALWSASAKTNGNDYAGQLIKITGLASLDGIGKFLTVVLGQLLYIGMATFGLAWLGIVAVAKKLAQTITILVRGLKAKERPRAWQAAYPFIGLAFLFNFIISALFMSTAIRLDHYFYGRYNEGFFGVLLLVGILGFCGESGVRIRDYIGCVISYLLATIVMYQALEKIDVSLINTITVVGIYPFVAGGTMNMALPAVCVCVVAAVLVFAKSIGKKMVAVATLAAVSLAFVSFGSLYLYQMQIPASVRNYSQNEIAEIVRDSDLPVYIQEDETNAIDTYFLQFLINGKPLHVVTEGEPQPEQPHYFILTWPQLLQLEVRGEIVKATDALVLLKVDAASEAVAKAGITLPQNLFCSEVGEEQNGKMRSTGAAGYLLCGPYLELSPGGYTCSMTLRLLEEASGEIGFIDVAYGEGASQVEQLPLMAEDFSQGEPSTFCLGFRAKANETYEFRVFVYEDVVLELEEVSLASGAPPANALSALAAPAEWSPDELRDAGFGTMMKFAKGEPWVSDGRAGMLLNGPYKQLQPGGYALDVGLRLEQAGAGDIGFIDVACGEDRQQIAVLPLTGDLFGADGTARLQLPFDAEGDGRYEFRVIVNQGAVLELTSVGLEERKPDTAQMRPAV